MTSPGNPLCRPQAGSDPAERGLTPLVVHRPAGPSPAAHCADGGYERGEGSERRRFSAVDRPQLAMASDAAVMPPSQWKNPMPATYRMPMTIQLSTVTSPAYLVCGKPRSTFDVAGSGHRDVTTLPRV